MKQFIQTILIAALCAVFPWPAVAQEPVKWLSRPAVVKHLKKQYAEVPVGIGITDNGMLIELLTSDGGATWTILISTPEGAAVIVAGGKWWMAVPKQKGDGL